MMLGEECESASYWKKCGDEALERGIKGVVMMVCRKRQLAFQSDYDREHIGTP